MIQESADIHHLDASLQMLSWFMNQEKAPLRIDEKVFAGHRYFLCSSGFHDDTGYVPVCGRGPTKSEAAVKCVGEWLERKAAFEFFQKAGSEVLAQSISISPNGEWIASEEKTKVPLLPTDFWTTNGWAVHTDLKSATRNAFSEALERSLLMTSFLRWGWQGFIEIGRMRVEDFELRSCISRYQTEHQSAGFAICSNKEGSSFGHFEEKTALIRQSPKWAHSLYESIDKLGVDLSKAKISDPLAVESEWYLKNSLDIKTADDKTLQEKIKFSSFCLHSENLQKKWNLPFPLWSSFVFGGDLMPLFVPRELSDTGKAYIYEKAQSLGFEAVIPERMPIL